jgi:Holliday junction resolvasome RuvABC endonuclease subunit
MPGHFVGAAAMTRVTLALDLGTNMGFAIARADGRIESGCERFAPKGTEGDGMRFVRFRRWLLELKQANEQLRHVAFERVVGGVPGQVYAAQVYGGFVAVLMVFCEHHQITYEGVHVGTIKKRWTGNGAAKKHDMIARCVEQGFKPANDNEADAIALLHIACDQVPELPIERQVKKRPLKKNPDTASAAIQFDPF